MHIVHHLLLLLLLPAPFISLKCSIIQLRRQLKHHRHNTNPPASTTSLLQLARLEFSLASCLERQLPSQTNIRASHHLEKSLQLSHQVLQQTSPIDKYHLRLATILHAQTLNALDRPLESRSYLRLVLRLFPSLTKIATQTATGANKIVLQSQYYFNLFSSVLLFETLPSVVDGSIII